MEPNQMVSLGFAEEKIPVGGHICQIYSDAAEGLDSLLKFLLSGLKAGERTACLSEKIDPDRLEDFLSAHGLSLEASGKRNAVTLSGGRTAYFKDDVFDPDHMLAVLEDYYRHSLELGFPAARLIGEMPPEVQQVRGGDRLIEYESRVSMFLKKCPITTVCQYDANAFDGAMIMEILKVHPQMVVNGAVIHNPFYIPPERYLESL